MLRLPEVQYHRIPVLSPGLIQFRKGCWVGLYPEGIISGRVGGWGGGYKRNKKNVSKQADNKTYFKVFHQIRNSNFNCNQNITKQDQTLTS